MSRLARIKALQEKQHEEEVSRLSGVPISATPGIDGLPLAYDYSDRGPADFVVSGPLGLARGRGRRFKNTLAALLWAREKYGERVSIVKPPESEEECTRWAILVKR